MFRSHLAHPVDVVAPSQLAMLQRVFDNACEASGIKKRTPQAEGLAATLLALYNSGTQNEVPERVNSILGTTFPVDGRAARCGVVRLTVH